MTQSKLNNPEAIKQLINIAYTEALVLNIEVKKLDSWDEAPNTVEAIKKLASNLESILAELEIRYEND